jgi:hypothetical protein
MRKAIRSINYITVTSIMLAAFLGLAGCAGRTPQPVTAYVYGDERKSCEELNVEIANLETKIAALAPYTNKTGRNVVAGVAGALVFWPALFFMDLQNAEKVEVESYQKRVEAFQQIKHRKGCP